MRLSIRTKRTRTNEDGFTLIEIVIALTVFMVAVMGMITLQGASINAATKARRHTAAVNIARYVITELKTEFAGWDKIQTSTNFPTGTYPLLSGIFSSSGAGQGAWARFGDNIDGTLGDFRLDEFLGHAQLENNDGASRFCVNYRVDPLEILPGDANPQGNSAGEHSVWQVRVRVSWTKEGAFGVNNTPWKLCDPTNVDQRIITDGSDDVVEILATATRELAR